VLAIDTCREGLPQTIGQLAVFGTPGRSLGGHHNGSDVAQVDVIDPGKGGFSSVTPVSGTQVGVDTFSQLEEQFCGDPRLADSLGRCILRLDHRTHTRYTVAGKDQCEGLLVLREGGNGGFPVYSLRAQASGARLCLGIGSRR
jgi:hypothetical protein